MDASYRHRRAITTRWADNDIYGHVNNVEYYAFFDTVINEYLITEGGLDIAGGDVIGLCAESHCTYRGALAFPETVEAGLRVGHLGRTSVRYEIALRREGADEPAAEGWFVHVFVDRETRRPAPIPDRVRAALEALLVAGPAA
ncbi:MAG: acyl-CoA thioester hydrolase [Solirubrobacteraceae bacterium]|jgi:acyl-CoA thioester hydrolase|nr:acyl-CoA thioester hydrolase [Solirubrobacteraceae bacterium]